MRQYPNVIQYRGAIYKLAATMTHEGILRGADSRTDQNWYKKVELRETKRYWIDQYGTRYDKRDGKEPGTRFPRFYLDLDTVEPK